MSLGTRDSVSSDQYVTVQAPYQLHGQVAAAISWLCTALRNSPHRELCQSSVSVKTSKSTHAASGQSLHMNKTIYFEPNDLKLIKNPTTCWHSLFPHNVIVHGHPIRPRLKGKGLEISFANLAHASQCLSFVEYENGLIAHGLKSVLIPVAELKSTLR